MLFQIKRLETDSARRRHSCKHLNAVEEEGTPGRGATRTKILSAIQFDGLKYQQEGIQVEFRDQDTDKLGEEGREQILKALKCQIFQV